MTKLIKLLMISTLLFSTSSVADNVTSSDVEENKDLKQSINLGFANTTGKTNTLNLNGKYVISYVTNGYNGQELRTTFDTSIFISENNSVQDNEEYKAHLILEQYISNHWLAYTSLNWFQNEFLNYDKKAAFDVGLGKEILNDGKHSFTIKLGVAYNMEDYNNTQETQRFASLNEYIEYNNKFNELSNFYVKIGLMQNFNDFSNDYEVLSVTGFNFIMGENLSLSLEKEMRYNGLPHHGFHKLNTKSLARIGYNF